MRKTLLTTVAMLALALGGSYVQAQTQQIAPGGGSDTGGSSQRGSSPSEGGGGAGTMREPSGGSVQQPGSPGRGTEQRGTRGTQGAETQRPEGQPGQRPTMRGQSQQPGPGGTMNTEQRTQPGGRQQPSTMQGQKPQPGPGGTVNTEQRNQPSGAQKPTTQGRSTQPGNQTGPETTGSVNITNEQQTTIRQTISERVQPVREVNFSINVGTVVPRTIELRPLPSRVVKIVPQYRSYRFFILPDGRIVIVEPSTYKIVTIITA